MWYCILHDGWNNHPHASVVVLAGQQQNREETGLVVDTKRNDAFATTRALFLQNIERLFKDFYAVMQPVLPGKYREDTLSSWKVREVRRNRRREVRTTSALQLKEPQDIESVCQEQDRDNSYESSSSPLDPHEGMILEVYQQHHDGYSSLDVSYELLQPMDLELGEVFDHHASDFAYQPILFHGTGIPPSSAATVGADDRHTSTHTESNNNLHHGMLEETSFRGWWQWWLPLWNRQHINSDRFSQYRTDDTAFAGGSHGKVWRARRKCRKATTSKYCQQPLILKRMDLKAGYRILEAGLRECYFGSLLAEKGRSTSDLFTHYIDHFFREAVDRLELWIVYEDAGVSLRGFLYTAVLVGDFLVYQNSWFWKQMRLGVSNAPTSVDADSDKAADFYTGDRKEYEYPTTDQSHVQAEIGKKMIKTILHQILESAAVLHHEGIAHRDIKPSNILCRSNIDIERPRRLQLNDEIFCKLGDFSSAYDDVVAHHYYTGGPSRKEQTDEYAPPEAIFGYAYENAREHLSPSFDSWSIGVVALELLLGTPSVFSVDQRTRAVLTHKLQKAGATTEEVKKAMYLAALSQYCIFNPSQGDWPLRSGDPLHNISMTKQSCTLYDFKHALRLRDPLALGFESSDLLLHLIWQLLAFDPAQRITAIDALHHPYFADTPIREELARSEDKAVESQMLDPRMDFTVHDTVADFVCPQCQRIFHDWRSCHKHAVGRKHANFCTYDKSSLPTCIGAHPMLPAHAYSGHCDIQGRRRTMEDFHSIHLLPTSSLYAILDGHNGNFASKFVAKYLRDELSRRIPALFSPPNNDTAVADWKRRVQDSVRTAFGDVHEKLLDAASLTPYTSMQQSGTTVTLALITNTSIVVGSIGDTRAVLSSRQIDSHGHTVLRPHQLTKDHVASDNKEKEMVELRGGRIEFVNGLYRVNGTLAITRSIGDAKLAPVLSREPDVVALTKNEWEEMCGVVNETIPCFLIIASDGLWDTMTNQEAVDMVSEVVLWSVQGVNNADWRETAAMQRAAEALTLEAFVRGSNDNIGVYVVALPLIETEGESSTSSSSSSTAT